MSVREWWARAHYALEEYFREPSRLAEASFWMAVLLLYASVEWTLRADTPVAGAGIGAITREILAIALLLPLLFALAARLSRQSVATRYLLHACAAHVSRDDREVLSLLRGTEPYKFRWRPDTVVNQRLLLARRRTAPLLSAVACEAYARNRARELVRGRKEPLTN